MANTSRSSITQANLQEWLYRKTLEVFEPNLYFHKMGLKPNVPSGYNTIRWSKFIRLTATGGSPNVDTLSEGSTPTAIAFDATTVSTTPTQYGVTVTITDMLIENSVLDWLGGAAQAIGDAMARKIDAVIQTTVMAGTNVIYGGTAGARTALGSGDIMKAILLNQAQTLLMANAAPTFDGDYVAIMHPNQVYDLRTETGSGNWLEVHKYAAPDAIFKGEIGKLSGVRVVEAPFVQSFSSTVTVWPCLVVGRGAYGVGEFQTLRTYLTPAVPTDSDPLVQRRTAGAKVAFGTKILQQNAMVRIETAATLAYAFSETSS